MSICEMLAYAEGDLLDGEKFEDDEDLNFDVEEISPTEKIILPEFSPVSLSLERVEGQHEN